MPPISQMELPELYSRADELRNEFVDLESGRRDDLDVHSMYDEVDMIDHWITMKELESRRQQQSLASAYGPGGQGRRSGLDELGDRPQWKDFVEAVARGDEASMRTVKIDRGIDDFFSFSGHRANVPAMSEWGSSGPPGYDPSGAGNLLPVGQPIPPVPRQARLFLRDLFPKMTTTLAAIPYVQELNPTVGEGASAVAEAVVKPNANMNFVGAKADPTVIAATLVISRQLFEDSPAVVQYINTRLPYMVKYKEDNAFLNGSGVWPEIPGILGNPNIQAIAGTGAAGGNAATFGTAFANVEIHDGSPTGIVMHPTNAWNMFVNRASTSGIFDAGTPFSALPLTVWGVPSYRTRAMTLNSALVADFELGGMIVDREQVNIRTYMERYAEENAVLLVCEERVGLALWRPDLFVSVTALG